MAARPAPLVATDAILGRDSVDGRKEAGSSRRARLVSWRSETLSLQI